jgi:hypothetical protein
MTTRNLRGSYPHPVLDASDDVDSYFDVSNARVSPTIEDIVLTFDVRTDDPTLRRLLTEGKAGLSLRWRCSATLASGLHFPGTRMRLADGYRYESSIDQRQVSGAVFADIRVLAVEPLRGFRWERQHPEYGDAVFDLRIGDVIADGGSFPFEADKLYDPLNPPIGSCFKFVADPKVHRGVRVTFEDDDAILVRLSPDVHRNLRLLGQRPELQISAVVLPALIQTVSYIQSTLADVNSEDLSERIWFKAIDEKVGRLGGFDNDAIEIAQKILDYPLDRILQLEADAKEDDE